MYYSDQPEHPGEIINYDLLPKLDMSHADFARHLGISRHTLSRIINKKQRINIDIARRLGKALGTDARYWLATQMQYDIWLAERETELEVNPLY